MAIAQREIATAKAGLRYPLMPEGLFSGPGQYQPSLSKNLPSLQNYLKVAPHVLPENKATHASVLWHGDLHAQNIFVDPADPSRIVELSTGSPLAHVRFLRRLGAQHFSITTAQFLKIWGRSLSHR